ncbi:MAG: hypothetical protein ACLUOF_06570 [Ruminococcus sp.]
MIRWKKIFAALPLLLTACASPTEQAQTETVWAMDTACTITLHGGGVSETASLLRTLDKMLDNYSTDSAVSRLNQSGRLRRGGRFPSGAGDGGAPENLRGQRGSDRGAADRLGASPQIRPTSRPGGAGRSSAHHFPEHVSVQADGTVTLTDGAS